MYALFYLPMKQNSLETNVHNTHVWSDVNQHQFSVNDNRISSFLNDTLLELLDEVPLDMIQRMWSN
jgi:hypothetical protein